MNAPFEVRVIGTLLLMTVVVILSIVPGRYRTGDSLLVWIVSVTPAPLQKLLHIVAYAILAMLCMWTLETLEPVWTRAALALAITVTLGAGLEWYQVSVEERYGTFADAVLNTAGSILGLLAALMLL